MSVSDYFPNCDFCDKPIDPKDRTLHKKVSGWAEAHRSGGGINTIALRQDLGQYAHGICVETAKLRHGADQPSLFS